MFLFEEPFDCEGEHDWLEGELTWVTPEGDFGAKTFRYCNRCHHMQYDEEYVLGGENLPSFYWKAEQRGDNEQKPKEG